MGMFEVKVKLANLATPSRTEEASLLVDTGATLSWIPRQVLESLGATVLSRLPFELADGRRLERDITTVLFTIDGRKAPVPVAFGEAGEAAVLGATAFESLGLMVDPVAQKLLPRNLRMLRATFLFREDGTKVLRRHAEQTRISLRIQILRSGVPWTEVGRRR